jgi:hypothetical protein
MLFVLLERPGEGEDVQIGKTEVESPQNVVHEVLECLGGIVQGERREEELEYAEWGGNAGLLYIIKMDGDLIACCHQFAFGEEGTTDKLVEVIMNMTDGLVVGDVPDVECSVVIAGTPTVAVLGHDV